jgi:hypothetical protein
MYGAQGRAKQYPASNGNQMEVMEEDDGGQRQLAMIFQIQSHVPSAMLTRNSSQPQSP